MKINTYTTQLNWNTEQHLSFFSSRDIQLVQKIFCVCWKTTSKKMSENQETQETQEEILANFQVCWFHLCYDSIKICEQYRCFNLAGEAKKNSHVAKWFIYRVISNALHTSQSIWCTFPFHVIRFPFHFLFCSKCSVFSFTLQIGYV